MHQSKKSQRNSGKPLTENVILSIITAKLSRRLCKLNGFILMWRVIKQKIVANFFHLVLICNWNQMHLLNLSFLLASLAHYNILLAVVTKWDRSGGTKERKCWVKCATQVNVGASIIWSILQRDMMANKLETQTHRGNIKWKYSQRIISLELVHLHIFLSKFVMIQIDG